MNKNEQGRSLVEMLGVLAIIGVLTLAGIQGYSMAMTRHRANEVLNVARLILQEQGAAKTTGTKIEKSSVWMGNLPDGCWICSYNGDDNKLLIGGCDEKIMNAFGSILGTQHWAFKKSLNCGQMIIQGTPTAPANAFFINACKNNADNFVYSND